MSAKGATTGRRWRKPTDSELRRAYDAYCEGPGPEEARRHLYDAGFSDGTQRERLRIHNRMTVAELCAAVKLLDDSAKREVVKALGLTGAQLFDMIPENHAADEGDAEPIL